MVITADGLSKVLHITADDRAVSASPIATLLHETLCATSVNNNDLIAIGSRAGNIKIFDIKMFVCQRNIERAHVGGVYCLSSLSHGFRLVSGGGLSDGSVRVWDINSGVCLALLGFHDGGVDAILELGADLLASAGADFRIKIWDTSLGDKHILSLKETIEADATDVHIEVEVKTDLKDDKVHTESPHSGPLRVIEGHYGDITSLALLGNGLLASGSHDQTVRLWHVATSGDYKDNSRGGGKRSIMIGGNCHKEGTVLSGHFDDVTDLCTLSDGITLVSCSKDKTIRLWDTRVGECAEVLRGHKAEVRWIVRLSGDLLVSCDADSRIILWSRA
jgi:WD40 repeat protein